MSTRDPHVIKGRSPAKTKSTRRHVHVEFIGGGGGHGGPQPGAASDGATGRVRVWVAAD
jgi:hypothetical protein